MPTDTAGILKYHNKIMRRSNTMYRIKKPIKTNFWGEANTWTYIILIITT